MWKKIAVGGAVAAATVGVGTAAIATSGSTTAGTPSTSASTSALTLAAADSGLSGRDRAHARGVLRRAAHAQWVSKDPKTGTYVTHDAARGTVRAVSATSISVHTPDDTTQTYAVNAATKVRIRQDKKGTDGSIGAVHTGDTVVVVGTGSGPFTATRVVDIKR